MKSALKAQAARDDYQSGGGKGERQAFPSRGDSVITALQHVPRRYFIIEFQLKYSYRMGVVKNEGAKHITASYLWNT